MAAILASASRARQLSARPRLVSRRSKHFWILLGWALGSSLAARFRHFAVAALLLVRLANGSSSLSTAAALVSSLDRLGAQARFTRRQIMDAVGGGQVAGA